MNPSANGKTETLFDGIHAEVLYEYFTNPPEIDEEERSDIAAEHDVCDGPSLRRFYLDIWEHVKAVLSAAEEDCCEDEDDLDEALAEIENSSPVVGEGWTLDKDFEYMQNKKGEKVRIDWEFVFGYASCEV
jgi:hypothetical protein